MAEGLPEIVWNGSVIKSVSIIHRFVAFSKKVMWYRNNWFIWYKIIYHD